METMGRRWRCARSGLRRAKLTPVPASPVGWALEVEDVVKAVLKVVTDATGKESAQVRR
jgi:hypothetical protein